MKKERIVFIIGSMRKGGAERVISILSNNYADLGWNVDIITLLDSKIDYKLNLKINIINMSNNKRKNILQLPFWIINLRRYIKQNKPDKIVSFIGRINIVTLIATLGLNCDVFISERNDPKTEGRDIITKALTYILYPLANKTIFQTNHVKKQFTKKIQEKSIVIANPIIIEMEAKAIRNKKIVNVGRLIEQKNQMLLIDSFKEISEKNKEYELHIYGSGRLKKTLERRIDELKISSKVFLHGAVENVHDKISDAEIFVLSSNYEGLSNALLEAMMMGIPCISTSCAGSTEAIVNGENGILIPIGSKTHLVEALEKLISNPDCLKQLGIKSKETSQRYKNSEIFKIWRSIIESQERVL